ncbi:MAG: sulfatase-like hydrolase/transferase [Anaerolineae bacterium]|nr:sulfatase-like hydrolase/transferase [Anaerolineae bacterium]
MRTLQPSRPNILFFFTDDQRFDTLGALGNQAISTPTMDSWIHQGTTFTHAHIMGGTSGAVCMPSRAMLMTGRTLFHLEREGQAIPAAHVLLGETLRRAGYRTFGTGKWHNGPPSYARSFTDGAEIFFGGMEDHWNVPACDFDPTGRYDLACPIVKDPYYSNEVTYRRCDHVTAGKHSSELFCEAAIDFLDGYDAGAPFFMYLSFMAPHDPRTMPKTYLDMYDPDAIALPPNFMPEHPFDNGELNVRDEKLAAWPRTETEIRRHIAEYYAMITHADAQMARVMEALTRNGHAGNTIVIFAGDNGLALGQHGLMGKQNMYDHSLRVPLVMCGPGIPQGKQSDAFCYLFDIYPTLCDLIGIPIPGTVEGKSLVPAMRNNDRIRETMYFAYRGLQRCVRDEHYKLIAYAVDGKQTTQLFDIERDPWELNTLAGDSGYAEQVSRLSAELVRWRDELDDEASPHGQLFWRTYRAES